MDTPERTTTNSSTAAVASAPSLSKFEDSPVFNFINSLSPIQPVKSVHDAQALHSLTFASISSIFASPHANPPKEASCLIRHPVTDFGKIDSDAREESKLLTDALDAVDLSSSSISTGERCCITCSLDEATVNPLDESPSHSFSPLPEFDCTSPNHKTTPCYVVRSDVKLEASRKPLGSVQLVHDGPDKRKVLFSTETELQQNTSIGKTKHKKKGDLEGLTFNEADDMLAFEDSIDGEGFEDLDHRLGDNNAFSFAFVSSGSTNGVRFSRKGQLDISSGYCNQYPVDSHVGQYHKIRGLCEIDHTPEILLDTCHSQLAKKEETQNFEIESTNCILLDCKDDSLQMRGTRRRCLVFEASGTSKHNLHKDSNDFTSKSLPPTMTLASNSLHRASLKPLSSPSPCMLPGIGLHLNALATTSKDRTGTHDKLSIAPFHPATSGQQDLDTSFITENSLEPSGSKADDLHIVLYDNSQADKMGEEMTQNNPKKKRRKSENNDDGEGCKRCNCKKSKCLKLYCECFAAGVYCVEPCSCQGCFNKPIHEEMVLTTRKQIESRNPLAFAPKVIHNPVQDMGEDSNTTPASARHKRGCNCKRSSCLKKYCECYQAGVGCSISCRCEGCKNAFGRKRSAESDDEGEDMVTCEDECEKEDGDLQIRAVQIEERTDQENQLQVTPQICRSSIKRPHVSSGKPPRSSKFPFGYSPLLNTVQTIRKCRTPLSRGSEMRNKAIQENDTPEILVSDTSPRSFVKTSSPNSKRVSPPIKGVGLSPGRKGSRKLILKSIPSFPSLRSDTPDENPLSCSMTSFSSS